MKSKKKKEIAKQFRIDGLSRRNGDHISVTKWGLTTEVKNESTGEEVDIPQMILLNYIAHYFLAEDSCKKYVLRCIKYYNDK